MKTVPYTRWYDEVLPHLSGVGKPLVLNAIKSAVIEFCERSRVWVEATDAITVTDSDEAYEIPVPRNTASVRVERVWFDGKELDVVNEDQLSTHYRRDWRLVVGTPKFLTQLQPDCFYMIPRPVETRADVVRMMVSLKPGRTAASAPAFLHERYMDAVTHGAMARLHRMPGKPWTSIELAIAHSAEFDAACAAANVEANKAFGRARPRAVPLWM